MTQDLKSGAIDGAQGMPQAQFDVIAKTKGLTAVAYNYRNWDYLCMNCYTARPRRATRYSGTCASARPELGHRQAEAGRRRLAGRAEPGHDDPAARRVVRPRLPLAAAGRRPTASTRQGERSCSTQAGYNDTNGDGVRDDKGKPIDLRLCADSEHRGAVRGQAHRRLAQDVGLKIELRVIDSGALSDDVWNFDGNTYAPDFDLYVWAGTATSTRGRRWPRSRRTRSAAGTSPVGRTPSTTSSAPSRRSRSTRPDASSSSGACSRSCTSRRRDRAHLPEYLQAYDSAKWTGWTRILNGTGPAFYVTMPDTYLNLRLATTKSTSRSSTLWIALVVLAAAVVVGAATWLIRRGLHTEAEE